MGKIRHQKNKTQPKNVPEEIDEEVGLIFFGIYL
jgi:hypothetical protein